MESPNNDETGTPFFESSGSGENSIQNESLDGSLYSNFLGLDFMESETVSEQPADGSRIVADGLPDLSDILSREADRYKRKKGAKKIKKTEYDDIINRLLMYGDMHGFKDDYLALIWELVSSQTTALNCTQRRKLIFGMLPEQQVDHKVINTTLYWLKEDWVCKPTVLTAVYQLLSLYFENRLDDDNEIISTNTVSCILTARTENFIIPWKTRLFRNIVTPEILTLGSIDALKKLLETNGIKKTQQDDIHATLGLCKYMRPDLFTNDVLPPWKMRVLNFPKDASERFYNAKLRIQNEGSARHPLQDRIFPEFLPDCYASNARKTILVDMLACLDSDEETAFLAMNPVLLQVFEEWLKPMLNYRFHYFSGFSSKEDEEKYRFMLLKIEHITKIRQEGLKVINEWLMDFFCSWDFWMFSDIILTILAYIPPHVVLRHGEMLSKKFLTQFRYSPNSRITIWRILENWFYGWTEETGPIEGGGDESSVAIISNVDCRKWLLELMTKCVQVTLYTMCDGAEGEMLMVHFWGFIINLPPENNQIDFQKEETRGAIEALTLKLRVVNRVSETFPALGLD